MSQLTTIDEYLNLQPADVKAALQKIREAVHKATSGVEIEEVLSYQIPTFKYKGSLVSFGVAKEHLSFYVMSTSAMDTLKNDLKGYKVSGTTIHFTASNPLPDELIKKIVATRIQEKV